MAYKTLYRVFRPSVFDDVYGQRHITDILKKQVETGKPSHAYLFCGPRGTGKTSTAKIFANALNCLSPREGNPCGVCEVCKSFAGDAFVDIVEIDAASNNGVDNVRDIREKVSLLPAQGKYKVYIIDEVHMLSAGAFNALLKTLEEPPPHAVFILATTEIRKVPATILSRCQKYDFKRITREDIIARLAYVAEQTGIQYEPAALELIAEQAEGAMRDALSIMDQCIAGKEELTARSVTESMGVADSAAVAELADAVMTENPGAALGVVNRMVENGVPAHNILRDLICALSGELAAHVQDAYQCANILRSLEALISVQATLRYSNVPQAVLTAAVVRAAVNTTDVDTGDLGLRMKKLEERVERLSRAGAAELVSQTARQTGHQGQSPADAQVREAPREKDEETKLHAVGPAQPAAVGAAAKQAAESPEAGQSEPHDLEEGLKRFQEGITQKNMALLPAASVITRAERKGDGLVFYAAEEDAPLAGMLTNAANRAEVDAVLADAFGEGVSSLRIACERQEEEPGGDDIRRELIEMFGEANVEIKE